VKFACFQKVLQIFGSTCYWSTDREQCFGVQSEALTRDSEVDGDSGTADGQTHSWYYFD
jgi:hypothetical protein